MSAWEIVLAILVPAISSGGLATIYVAHRLNKAAREAEEDRQYRHKRRLLERQWMSCLGRTIFWMVRSIKSQQPPGEELAQAHADFEEAAAELNELEQDRIAQWE